MTYGNKDNWFLVLLYGAILFGVCYALGCAIESAMFIKEFKKKVYIQVPRDLANNGCIWQNFSQLVKFPDTPNYHAYMVVCKKPGYAS